MFEVEIKNLKTKAKIGISSKERTKFQTLLITCRFKYSIIKKDLIFKKLKNIFTTSKIHQLQLDKIQQVYSFH